MPDVTVEERGMMNLGRAPPPCEGVGVVEEEDGASPAVIFVTPAAPAAAPPSVNSESESVTEAAGEAGRSDRCGVLCGDRTIPGVSVPEPEEVAPG